MPYLRWQAATLLAVASLGLLIRVGVLAALMVKRVNGATGWITQSLRVEAKATELLRQTPDLRIGECGYVLTGENAFLEPYQNRCSPAFLPRSTNCGRLPLTIPVRSDAAIGIRMAMNEVMAESARPVELTRNGDAAVAVKSGRGLQVTDDLRVAFDDFFQVENDLLSMQLAAEAQARTLTLALVIASSVT